MVDGDGTDLSGGPSDGVGTTGSSSRAGRRQAGRRRATQLRREETRDGWRLIRSSLRTQWKGITLGVGAGLVWTAAKVSVPELVQQAIDDGITADDGAALARWTAAIALAAVIAATFTGIRRWSAFRESRLVEARLRDRLFRHVQQLHFGYHDHVPAGELMSRGNTDLLQVQNFVVLIPLTISNFFTVAAVTVLLAVIDPVLTLLALGSLPLLNFLGKRFSTRLHPTVVGIQRESAELAAVVEESVSGVRVVKGFGAQAVQARKLATEADDIYDTSMAAARVRARFVPAMELLPNIGLIMVLGYGGYQVMNDSLTLGELVAFTAYIGLLIWPLRMLGMIIAQAQRAAASATRVAEVLGTDPEVSEPARPVALPARPAVADTTTPERAPVGAVRFDNVSFGYGRLLGAAGTGSAAGLRSAGAEAGARLVLDHFDLQIDPGESVALVGSTGSGKSTIARLLARFYDVDDGCVLLDGVDVRDLSLRELRRAIGIVFEETFLFSATVGENIAFAEPDADDDEIERAARLAGAQEFIERLPAGYATEIGERGFSLSGGQRQRLAIARAILADPRVLILDDATSSVDPTKEHEIRDALAQVMDGRTTVVIAHRPATVALADRVVLLHRGKVAAEGTHSELLRSSAEYRNVLAAGEAASVAGEPGEPGEPVR